MKQATLFMLIDDEKKRILLGMKKRGFGEGKYNGFGGKVEQGEFVKEAALRELHEESSVVVHPGEAHHVAVLDFFFSHKPEWNQQVHVFKAHTWQGEAKESEEMRPEYFDFADIPFSKMWNDDKHWLPRILAGEKVKAAFTFGEDGEKIVDMHLDDLRL